MRLKLVVILAFSILGCAHSPNIENEKITPKEVKFQSKNASLAKIVECQKQGGKVEKVGVLQFDKCIITYPDVGKTCTKGEDCQSGRCEPKSNNALKPTEAITGVCKADNNPFGCRSFIENGQVLTLCVD